MRQTLITLGVTPIFVNYETAKKYISRLGLSTEHWTGQGSGHGNHVSDEDYFAKGTSHSGGEMRERLIRDGHRIRRCESCGLAEWLEKPIGLQVHHRDGNRKNNLLGNLQLLCTNCHEQTDNWCFRGRYYKSA